MDDLFGGALRNSVDDLLDELWLTPGWPRDEARDRVFCAELLRQFPEKNLADELGQWRVWLIGKGKKEMVTNSGRYSRIRNWCSGRWLAGSGTTGNRNSRTSGRTSTAARPASAFAGQPRGLHRW